MWGWPQREMEGKSRQSSVLDAVPSRESHWQPQAASAGWGSCAVRMMGGNLPAGADDGFSQVRAFQQEATLEMLLLNLWLSWATHSTALLAPHDVNRGLRVKLCFYPPTIEQTQITFSFRRNHRSHPLQWTHPSLICLEKGKLPNSTPRREVRTSCPGNC